MEEKSLLIYYSEIQLDIIYDSHIQHTQIYWIWVVKENYFLLGLTNYCYVYI